MDNAYVMLVRLLDHIKLSSGKNSDEVAKELLMRFGSVSSVIHAPVLGLRSNGLLSMDDVIKIKLFGAMHKYVMFERAGLPIDISDKKSIAKLLRSVFYAEQTELLYIFPVANGRVTGKYYIGSGNEISISLSVNPILEKLKYTYDCDSFIMAHNHPDGTISPSEQDMTSTAVVCSEASRYGFELKKHYIYAKGKIMSIPVERSCIDFFFSG